jgi:hypothetical protein
MPDKRHAAAIALAFALLPAAGSADRADSGDSAADDAAACCGARIVSYRNYTQQVIASCRRTVRLRPRESVATEDPHKLRNCIASGTRDSRERLESVLRALRHRPARDALKHYQDMVETALAGIEPTPDEPTAAYEQRQSSLRHWVAHAWQRFELREK